MRQNMADGIPSDTETQTKPAIDHQFWFDMSREMIRNATTSRNAAASRIQTMTVWLWGIYVASVSVGVALARISYPTWAKTIVLVPSVLLICAYLFAALVMLPVGVRFDPRSPDEIQKAYHDGVKAKTWKLHTATGLFLLAALSVSLAIVLASCAKPGA